MRYKHQILLDDLKKKGKIKIEELPVELQTVIEDFEKREKLEQDQETSVSVLEANSLLIAQRIYDYHVEPEDQEVELTAQSTAADIHTVADEIAEEANAENQTAENNADATSAEAENNPPIQPQDQPTDTSTQMADDVPAQGEQDKPLEQTPAVEKKEEPTVDPVAAAIAAGAAKPEAQSSTDASTPIASKVDAQAIPGYEPKEEEAILHQLFTSGKKEGLTIADLKEAGISTGRISGLDATKYGRYKVVPAGLFTKKFNLIFK